MTGVEYSQPFFAAFSGQHVACPKTPKNFTQKLAHKSIVIDDKKS